MKENIYIHFRLLLKVEETVSAFVGISKSDPGFRERKKLGQVLFSFSHFLIHSMGQFSILYTYFVLCQTHWLTSINFNRSNWLGGGVEMNRDYIISPTTLFVLPLPWIFLESTPFQSVFISLRSTYSYGCNWEIWGWCFGSPI